MWLRETLSLWVFQMTLGSTGLLAGTPGSVLDHPLTTRGRLWALSPIVSGCVSLAVMTFGGTFASLVPHSLLFSC